MNIKRIIGYEKIDNVLTGFGLGTFAILLLYYFQGRYYSIGSLGYYALDFEIPFLKRALLGALIVFLVFNYFDKLYAMRGAILSVIMFGIYLVIKIFFS